jgi:ribosomal protein S27AE
MIRRRYHPRKDLSTLGPLSLDEYQDFRNRRRHILFALGLLVFFIAAVAVAANVFKLDPPPALLLIPVFTIGLYLIFRMFRYTCPRCGATPMAPRVSLITYQVEASQYVALNPKKCLKCGVSFRLETEEGVATKQAKAAEE